MTGERKQHRMVTRLRRWSELMPGAAAEAHGEQAIRRDADLAQIAQETVRVVQQRLGVAVREAQQRTTAAGDGGEHPMPGVPVERMALHRDGEGIERRCIALS